MRKRRFHNDLGRGLGTRLYHFLCCPRSQTRRTCWKGPHRRVLFVVVPTNQCTRPDRLTRALQRTERGAHTHASIHAFRAGLTTKLDRNETIPIMHPPRYIHTTSSWMAFVHHTGACVHTIFVSVVGQNRWCCKAGGNGCSKMVHSMVFYGAHDVVRYYTNHAFCFTFSCFLLLGFIPRTGAIYIEAETPSRIVCMDG